jgi:hypothetical protein
MSTQAETVVSAATGRQWLRKAELYLANQAQALVISDLRFTFQIQNAVEQTPNIAMVRVYNLSEDKVRMLTKNVDEFNTLRLQAGYEHSFGTIFQGTIKQFRKGKEGNVDTYLDIYAADGDLGYNFGVVNQTLEAGCSVADEVRSISKQMGNTDVPQHALDVSENMGGILPRGKVLWGLGRDRLSEVCNSGNVNWSLQQGQLTLVELDGYLPGTAVQLNSQTGMIGQPEATDNGIEITCLLNPLIRIGGRVQINNADINKTLVTGAGMTGFPSQNENQFFARTTDDGIYKVLVAEHEGDTRGEPWFTHITCLNVDPSSGSVLPWA